MELFEPVDAGGGLLAAADDAGQEVFKLRAHELYQLAAVVDDDVGTDGEHGVEVPCVFLGRRPVDGVDFDAAGGEGRRDVVLRGERVRAGHEHLRAAGGEHAAEIGGLGLKVDGECDLHAREGLLALKVGLNVAQDGHISAYPCYFFLTGGGEGDVFDLIHVGYLQTHFNNLFILSPTRPRFQAHNLILTQPR